MSDHRALSMIPVWAEQAAVAGQGRRSDEECGRRRCKQVKTKGKRTQHRVPHTHRGIASHAEMVGLCFCACGGGPLAIIAQPLADHVLPERTRVRSPRCVRCPATVVGGPACVRHSAWQGPLTLHRPSTDASVTACGRKGREGGQRLRVAVWRTDGLSSTSWTTIESNRRSTVLSIVARGHVQGCHCRRRGKHMCATC